MLSGPVPTNYERAESRFVIMGLRPTNFERPAKNLNYRKVDYV